VFERCVCGENRVVRLDDRGRQLWCGIHAKLELRFLAIVGGETLEKECAESRASTTAEGVEDKEALKASTVVREPTDLVHRWVDKLFADRIVSTCIYKPQRLDQTVANRKEKKMKRTVVCGVFFPRDHALGVEERTHGATLDLVDDAWLEVDIERAGDILARARLCEERGMADVLAVYDWVFDAPICLWHNQCSRPTL
jgi:hypothetical protein